MVATLIEAFGNLQSSSQSESECQIFAGDGFRLYYCGNYTGTCESFNPTSQKGQSFLNRSPIETCNFASASGAAGTPQQIKDSKGNILGWYIPPFSG